MLALSCPLPLSSRPSLRSWKTGDGNPNPRVRVFCSQKQFHNPIEETKREYIPGFVDDLFLNFFRKKMVEEVGWNSEKLGFDGLIEVARRLMMKSGSNLVTEQSAVLLLFLYLCYTSQNNPIYIEVIRLADKCLCSPIELMVMLRSVGGGSETLWEHPDRRWSRTLPDQGVPAVFWSHCQHSTTPESDWTPKIFVGQLDGHDVKPHLHTICVE